MKTAIRLALLLLFGACSCFAQGACPSGSPISGNHCYFISSAAGNDSNNGTSESTPWANAPEMSSCTGTCATATPTGGTVFIFRGCDTWNFATIGQWDLRGYSGSAGNYIYYGGFDQTWYNTSVCSSGWNRPIFSGEGTWPAGAGPLQFVFTYGDSYYRIAWIEFTGMYYTGNQTNSYISAGQSQNFEIDHSYFHGVTYGSISQEPYLVNLNGGGRPGVSGEMDHNVCTGVDATTQGQGLVCLAAVGDGLEVDHNWFEWADNCIGGSEIFLVHDNTFNHCGIWSSVTGGVVHNNQYEQNSDPPSTGSITYNNLFENAGDGAHSLVTQIAPPASGQDYYFNNVTTNFQGIGGDPLISCYGSGPGTCNIFNNTFECGIDSGSGSPPSRDCVRNGDHGATTTNLNYNQLITSSDSPISNSSGTVNQTPNPNLTQTLSAANGQGYTISNDFAPTNGSGSTIQAGMSPSTLATMCSTISAVSSEAGTACLSSTTAGVTLATSPYYAVGGSPVTPVARFTNGSVNNDEGAFAFGSGISGQPNPPFGLVATLE